MEVPAQDPSTEKSLRRSSFCRTGCKRRVLTWENGKSWGLQRWKPHASFKISRKASKKCPHPKLNYEDWSTRQQVGRSTNVGLVKVKWKWVTVYAVVFRHFFILFLIGGELVYNVLLVSVIQQHKSAIIIHISKKFFKYLLACVFIWLCWVLIAAPRILAAASGLQSARNQ